MEYVDSPESPPMIHRNHAFRATDANVVGDTTDSPKSPPLGMEREGIIMTYWSKALEASKKLVRCELPVGPLSDGWVYMRLPILVPDPLDQAEPPGPYNYLLLKATDANDECVDDIDHATHIYYAWDSVDKLNDDQVMSPNLHPILYSIIARKNQPESNVLPPCKVICFPLNCAHAIVFLCNHYDKELHRFITQVPNDYIRLFTSLLMHNIALQSIALKTLDKHEFKGKYRFFVCARQHSLPESNSQPSSEIIENTMLIMALALQKTQQFAANNSLQALITAYEAYSGRTCTPGQVGLSPKQLEEFRQVVSKYPNLRKIAVDMIVAANSQVWKFKTHILSVLLCPSTAAFHLCREFVKTSNINFALFDKAVNDEIALFIPMIEDFDRFSPVMRNSAIEFDKLNPNMSLFPNLKFAAITWKRVVNNYFTYVNVNAPGPAFRDIIF